MNREEWTTATLETAMTWAEADRAALNRSPELAPYIEAGDTDLDAARLRYRDDVDQALAKARSLGVVLHERVRRGELLTTSLRVHGEVTE